MTSSFYLIDVITSDPVSHVARRALATLEPKPLFGCICTFNKRKTWLQRTLVNWGETKEDKIHSIKARLFSHSGYNFQFKNMYCILRFYRICKDNETGNTTSLGRYHVTYYLFQTKSWNPGLNLLRCKNGNVVPLREHMVDVTFTM